MRKDFSDSENEIKGYTVELESWEYDFLVDHFIRNEDFRYLEDESEFIAIYEGSKDIFWRGSKDETSAWLRTFMPESEADQPVKYLESINEDRVAKVSERAREAYGV